MENKKRKYGRVKGALNKSTLKRIEKEMYQPQTDLETKVSSYRNAGRKKGSLNKSTLEKIANKEILDPRLYPPVHYKHPGRPKLTQNYVARQQIKEQLLTKDEEKVKKTKVKKETAKERLENSRQFAVDWCYKHNAELYKYSEQFFVFRYKNDPTRRRYQMGYEYGDYPIVWLPFTLANLSAIEM